MRASKPKLFIIPLVFAAIFLNLAIKRNEPGFLIPLCVLLPLAALLLFVELAAYLHESKTDRRVRMIVHHR